jgi:2-oxoglutarate dehydrogenase E1 component
MPASVVIHGDAAFCGQGVVMESLKLAQHAGYGVGGTVHVIVNNQIGFTTPNPLDPLNHGYCTDIARIVGAPVLHVNADQPEAVLRAARIAFDYRMQFGADVVIDLVGYRRWGHAEQDTATVTQPLLHGFIDKHPPVTQLYAQAGWPGSHEGRRCWPPAVRRPWRVFAPAALRRLLRPRPRRWPRARLHRTCSACANSSNA